ncbi:unnamed protein product [Rhizophagus irregularis]|nr:unnamed protein product [Rhizophagus irregularis]
MNENGCRDFVRHRQNIPHDNNQSPYINIRSNTKLEKDKGELSTKNDNLLQKNTNLENQLKNIVQQKILLDNEISDLNEINQKQRQRIDCSQRSLDLVKDQIQNLEKEKEELEAKNNNLVQRNTNLEINLILLSKMLYLKMNNRGFVNVIDNKGENDEHPFINSRKDDLNKVMNIKSPRTVTEYLWIPNNTKVDQTIMKANDDDDDDADVDT